MVVYFQGDFDVLTGKKQQKNEPIIFPLKVKICFILMLIMLFTVEKVHSKCFCPISYFFQMLYYSLCAQSKKGAVEVDWLIVFPELL